MRYLAVAVGTVAVTVAAAAAAALAWLLHKLDVDLAGNRAFGDIQRTRL